jgi:hypothetical protein
MKLTDSSQPPGDPIWVTLTDLFSQTSLVNGQKILFSTKMLEVRITQDKVLKDQLFYSNLYYLMTSSKI